jgi:hypothetical protein
MKRNYLGHIIYFISVFFSFLFEADYTKTEGFLSKCAWNGFFGVTMSLQHIWSTLALAMLINRTFILSHLPASAVMRGANKFIPFTDLFDINVLRRAYGPSCCASPDELDENTLNFTRSTDDYNQILREFRGDKSNLTAHKHIQVCGAPFDLVVEANITSVYENTRPHLSLKKIIRSRFNILSTLQVINTTLMSHQKPATICIHLRTESDFMNYYHGAPAAYTREQIFSKMNLTRNKYTNTSFAKLWSQNNKHAVKPVLYLAGDNKKDAKEFFMKTDWFSMVQDKDSIFNSAKSQTSAFAEIFVQYYAPASLLSSLRFELSTVLAIIDLEICKKADIFIGNHYSSLSERIASERQRSSRWEGNATRTLENGGKYNYMVNAFTKDATSLEDFSKLEPLLPFCAANSPKFMSYRCL